MYIADRNNNRIRKVTSTGIITTIAGTGASSFSGDNGAATSAVLNGPGGVAVDTSGNVFIADTFNNRVRKVTVLTGIITTIAGSSTSSSFSGDNGQATSATFTYPEMVKLDSAGDIFISDCGNHRIRKVTVSTGIITTFAGNGLSSYNGDNMAATSACLARPLGFTLDSAGKFSLDDVTHSPVILTLPST
jgi:sugar lactone lactonase YvrE